MINEIENKILNIETNKILFVFALESESGMLFNDYQVIYTGIGKVNAAFKLTQAIERYKPELIINLGTAGSDIFKKYDIVNCTQFIQRDMDVRGLGFDLYKTPLTQTPIVLNYGITFPNIKSGICGTGDSFETSLKNKPYNVVDMEGYALALIAQNYDIPFLCLKFISDGADDEAADNWKKNVIHAAEAFYKLLFI
jgi:adenosylhomocysteine nucleosidase